VRSLDLGEGGATSPIAAIELSDTSRVAGELRRPADVATALLERAHPAVGDYQLVIPRPARAEDLFRMIQWTHAAKSALDDLMADSPDDAKAPSFQIGTASDWIEAARLAQVSPVKAMADVAAAGLRVISDGVVPREHPAFGAASRDHWGEFWTAAGEVGIRGNAALLHGPSIEAATLLDQIQAIATTEGEVFASVSPLIRGSDQLDPADSLLTQGQQDLRVLAACRLGLADIPHVRMVYGRSDLKMAHLSLACGVDDLEGQLFVGERDAKADTESDDLSLTEMERWLHEAGYTAALRNGAFETLNEVESNEA
jgi:hypothetical protein